MEEALKEYGVESIRVGDVLTGSVISVSDKEITVNIGYRSDGIVDISELPNETTADYKENDKVDVMVVKTDDGEGSVILSVNRANYTMVWSEFSELMESKDSFEVIVKEAVKGGLVARYKGARVFIPASLASDSYLEDLSVLVGKNLLVKMEDLDLDKKKAVASRRAVEKIEKAEARNEAFQTLRPGAIKSGKVVRIEKYGAFIDLGGYDGLMHVSQMSWRRIESPNEVMKVGDVLDVEIINVDPVKQKISLKLVDMPESPWNNLDKYEVGKIYEGKVVRIQPFGAFISLEDGLEGLCHVSQVSANRVKTPSDVLKEGDVVQVKLISMDKEAKKLSLSIKQTIEGVEEDSSDYRTRSVREKQPSAAEINKYIDEVKPTTLADLFADKLSKYRK